MADLVDIHGESRLRHLCFLRLLSRRERFILLSAAQTAEHGFGGTCDVFSGSWVKPKWSDDAHRALSAHDAGTYFLLRRRYNVSLGIDRSSFQAASIWLKGT